MAGNVPTQLVNGVAVLAGSSAHISAWIAAIWAGSCSDGLFKVVLAVTQVDDVRARRDGLELARYLLSAPWFLFGCSAHLPLR